MDSSVSTFWIESSEAERKCRVGFHAENWNFKLAERGFALFRRGGFAFPERIGDGGSLGRITEVEPGRHQRKPPRGRARTAQIADHLSREFGGARYPPRTSFSDDKALTSLCAHGFAAIAAERDERLTLSRRFRCRPLTQRRGDELGFNAIKPIT